MDNDMEAGIVGLPNVGKSTLFNALTQAGALAANYPFATIDPNVGAVPVPDPRLDVIQSYIQTQKVVPAVLKLVDIAGLVRGASKGEGKGNAFLSHIRNVDAITQVVRCFENDDITHVDGKVDPLSDIETIETELLLSDLQVAEAAIDKAKRQARTGEKEAKRRLELLEQIVEILTEGQPVRSMGIEDAEDVRLLKGYGFITAKRMLYIANVSDDDVNGESELVSKVRQHADHVGGEVVIVSAQIESELGELDDEERAEMLSSLGMAEPALNKVARAIYKLLGYQSFFTAGEKEVRAWTVKHGATAPQAAGVIHTDFERCFIRAEIYAVSDLEELKNEQAIKAAGKMRVEGKHYVMQDGDVCHFLTSA